MIIYTKVDEDIMLCEKCIKKVSNSQVNSYLSCPYGHYLYYKKRLRPKKPKRPLQFGSDFHKLLEFRKNKYELSEALKGIENTYYDMPSKFQEELGDNYIDDLKTVFNDYRKVWKGSDKPVETEHEFLCQIGTIKGEPIYFHGIIDEVYKDLIMGEHKTFSTAPDMGTLAMNMQVCLYSKAWELETGDKLQRVIWDYIKSKPADRPVWLEKSKRFSEAANQNITPYSWLRACKERGITDEAVLSKANHYSQNISNFFFRCTMEILPVMVESVWEDFKTITKDIFKRGDSNKVKNISRSCSWCNYRPICYAEFTGADVEYVLKTDYIIKEDKK